jgi:hypothetical protein
VHEFVNNHGLQCLIKIGGAADQNYQNYILRGSFEFNPKEKPIFINSTWSINVIC